jgi:hypothetical protein
VLIAASPGVLFQSNEGAKACEGTLDIRLTYEGYSGRGWPYVNGLTSARRFF